MIVSNVSKFQHIYIPEVSRLTSWIEILILEINKFTDEKGKVYKINWETVYIQTHASTIYYTWIASSNT